MYCVPPTLPTIEKENDNSNNLSSAGVPLYKIEFIEQAQGPSETTGQTELDMSVRLILPTASFPLPGHYDIVRAYSDPEHQSKA